MYLFISPNGDQLTQPGAVKALRCQLPRDNPYYPYHPQEPPPATPPQLTEDQLTEALDRDPWRSEQHAQQASNTPSTPAAGVGNEPEGEGQSLGCPQLLEEAELVVEPEPEGNETDDAAMKAVMQQYEMRNAEVSFNQSYFQCSFAGLIKIEAFKQFILQILHKRVSSYTTVCTNIT